MIGLFVRLKLRLIRNSLKTSSGYAFVIFSFVALVASAVATLLILSTSTETLRWVAPAVSLALTIGWVVGPLLFGSADETIDTTRLALYPLRGRQLAPGVAAANLIGPGPVAVAVPLLAFATRPVVDSGWSGLFRSALIAVAAFLILAFAVVASRLMLTVLGNALRKRNRRDFATLIAGLGAGSLAIGSQLLLFFGFDGDTIRQIGTVGRWFPGGWAGEAVGQLASGGAVWVPLGLIFGTAVLIGLMAARLVTVLDKALTEVSEGGEAENIGGHVLKEPKLGWIRFVPSDRLVRVQLLRLIVAKEVRYLRRHPRYRIQVVSQVIVLVLGGAPFISAILNRQPESVLVGCVPALTAGITSSNLFGADGRALWGEVLALPSLKPILQGRSLTFALMGLISAFVVTLGSAIWTGGWKFVPVALGAAVGMALTGAAVGAFTSTVAPVNFPEDNNPNPFATENTGQGCVNAIITFSGVLAGLVMAGPILAGLAFSRTSVVAGVAVIAFAPFYGLGLYLLLTNLAAKSADRKAPELVSVLSS